MDLKNLSKTQINDTYTFDLLHPETGDELGAKITVVSLKSDQSLAYMNKKLRRDQMQELENAKSRKPKLKEVSDFQAEAREMALSRLADWQGVEWDGKPLPFNEQNALMLLTECDWIIEQVLEHSNDLGKFLNA